MLVSKVLEWFVYTFSMVLVSVEILVNPGDPHPFQSVELECEEIGLEQDHVDSIS